MGNMTVMGAQSESSSASPRPFCRLGVVGSGIMGAGIAEVAARSGYQVVVRSRQASVAKDTAARLARSLQGQAAKGRITTDEADAALALVRTTDALDELADCDLVIESVVENLATKKELFAALDAICDERTLLASNTSTLPVVELAMATRRPEQVCGIHFFNPAPAMKLVELVRPITASDETIAGARAFVASCGKDGVEVVDRAGFIVNALLFPYLNDAVRMWERGTATMEDVDTAMRGGCNFPMGPFALLDLVGLDTSVAILDALHTEFADPHYAPVPTLRRYVAAGRLGRKTKRGFYQY